MSNIYNKTIGFIRKRSKAIMVAFWAVLFIAIVSYNLLYYSLGFTLYSDKPCQFWQATGMLSPSCGGTRMTHYFFTFHFGKAFFYNPQFAMLYIEILVYLAIITVQLFRKSNQTELTEENKSSINNTKQYKQGSSQAEQKELSNIKQKKPRGVFNWLFDNSGIILKVNIIYPIIVFTILALVVTLTRNHFPAFYIRG